VIERLLISETPAPGVLRLHHVCFVELVGGVEAVAAELGVGPAGALEAGTIRPVLGQVVEEAACVMSDTALVGEGGCT